MKMTEQQIATINKYRGHASKISLASLYEIYDQINGTSTKNCWCSSQQRKTKLSEFNDWYDKLEE